MASNQTIKRAAPAPARVFPFSLLLDWLLGKKGWEILALAVLTALIPCLMFYNLELNPRTWHDEGDVLSVSRTLVEDGVYAARNSDGYLTYGPIQSVGPTVLLPVALAFRWFGVGLIQARVVAVLFALVTLLLFYLLAKDLSGRPAAIVAVVLLIASPGIRYFYTGRQVLGIVPAFGFFLAGCLLWFRAAKSGGYLLAGLAGLMFGFATLTKSQYSVFCFAALGGVLVLDLLYYRLGTYRRTLVTLLALAAAIGAWHGWQYLYYGHETYLANAAKLSQLAQVSMGFRPSLFTSAVQMLLGAETGHFFLFWGYLAMVYVALQGCKKDHRGQLFAFLLLVAGSWLGYFLLGSIPWAFNLFAPMSVAALFVATLIADVTAAALRWLPRLKQDAVQVVKNQGALAAESLLSFGMLVAVLSFGLWMGNNFDDIVKSHVLDTRGEDATQWPRLFWVPQDTAEFLNQTVDRGAVIETSERELVILTSHTYHSPDQEILAKVIPAVYYEGEAEDYQLGESYFRAVGAEYVVIGNFARRHQAYDMDFIHRHYEPIATFGYDEWRNDIYRLKNGD